VGVLLEKCGAEYLAGYEYPSSGLRLYLGVGSENRVVRTERGICVVLEEHVAESDVKDGLLGEIFASFLLASPTEVVGDRSLLLAHAAGYVSRITGEENYRYQRLLGEKLHRHALASPLGLPAARMSRLARFYTWLRPLYSRTLGGPASRWLHEVVREAGLGGRRWVPLPELPLTQPHRRLGLGAAARTAVELARGATSLDVLRAIPPEAVIEGVGSSLAPPLRDPLLFLRLDRARLATRLVGFERQLYALTGVAGALRARRRGIIRSAKVIESEKGFVTAVVKHYRDPTIAKWLLAALLSLPLPQPRLRPKERLGAEYHYNAVLEGRGYRVPRPILVDPRRLRAAYTYVEGKTLAELLSSNPVPIEFREYGRLLASLHRDGVALWDSNPSNVILGRDGLYLVDLEQAREAASIVEKAWDIAVAVYYSVPYSLGGAVERAKLLATGYLEAGGDRSVVAEAARYRYAAPFAAVIPLNVLERIRRAIAYVAEAGPAGERP